MTRSYLSRGVNLSQHQAQALLGLACGRRTALNGRGSRPRGAKLRELRGIATGTAGTSLIYTCSTAVVEGKDDGDGQLPKCKSHRRKSHRRKSPRR